MTLRLIPVLLVLTVGWIAISCDAESITTPGTDPDRDEGPALIFGGSGSDEARQIIRTSDNGFLIAGFSDSDDGDFAGLHIGSRDLFLLKLNNAGHPEWLYNYGGVDNDLAFDLIEDSGGNFVITGYTYSNSFDFAGLNRGESDIFLIKVAPDGTLIWSRTYGGSREDHAYTITEDPNGGYIVAGSTRSVDGDFSGRNHDGADIALLRIGAENGQLSWAQTFGGFLDDEAYSVTVSERNTILATGTFRSSDGDFANGYIGGDGFFLLETELDGRQIGNITTYGGSGNDHAGTITATQDGGAVIAGHTRSDDFHFDQRSSGEEAGLFAMKLNADRQIEWIQSPEGSGFDTAFSALQLTTGDIVLTGRSESDDGDFESLNAGGSDAISVTLSPSGDLLQINTYGGSGDEVATSAAGLPTGEIALTGWTESSDGAFSSSSNNSRNLFVLFTNPLEPFE
jgi:hypothetical protein